MRPANASRSSSKRPRPNTSVAQALGRYSRTVKVASDRVGVTLQGAQAQYWVTNPGGSAQTPTLSPFRWLARALGCGPVDRGGLEARQDPEEGGRPEWLLRVSVARGGGSAGDTSALSDNTGGQGAYNGETHVVVASRLPGRGSREATGSDEKYHRFWSRTCVMQCNAAVSNTTRQVRRHAREARVAPAMSSYSGPFDMRAPPNRRQRTCITRQYLVPPPAWMTSARVSLIRYPVDGLVLLAKNTCMGGRIPIRKILGLCILHPSKAIAEFLLKSS